jgi:hypothetical protein
MEPLMSVNVPIRRIERLFHVGSLRSEDRKNGCALDGGSLEGFALSASPCPHAWRQIARRGGNDLWLLERVGGTFLDVHSALRSPKLMEHVRAWGGEMGFVEAANAWRLWQSDEEGRPIYSDFRTKDAAEHELDDEDESMRIEPVKMLLAKPSLVQLVGFPNCSDNAASDAREALLVAYAMRELRDSLGVDGFFASDIYEPEYLSAPRAGIFQEELISWGRKNIAWGMVDDEEELDAVPPVLRVPVESRLALAP